jgi:hypothetical protein
MPKHPCDFEIPDAWIAEAGMDRFTPTASAYRSNAEAVLVRLVEIEPPHRVPECIKDARGFDHARLVSVLRGIALGEQIEAVPLCALPDNFPPAPYRYRVRDGFHRFYASIAAGFEYLPGKIV